MADLMEVTEDFLWVIFEEEVGLFRVLWHTLPRGRGHGGWALDGTVVTAVFHLTAAPPPHPRAQHSP